MSYCHKHYRRHIGRTQKAACIVSLSMRMSYDDAYIATLKHIRDDPRMGGKDTIADLSSAYDTLSHAYNRVKSHPETTTMSPIKLHNMAMQYMDILLVSITFENEFWFKKLRKKLSIKDETVLNYKSIPKQTGVNKRIQEELLMKQGKVAIRNITSIPPKESNKPQKYKGRRRT